MLIRSFLVAALFSLGCVLHAAEGDKPAQAKPYPLSDCLMMGEKIDPTIPAEVYQGQEFRFCCKGCIKKFRKNPDKYMAMLKEKVAAGEK